MTRIAVKSHPAVAVIGIGIMGSAMAGHLAKAGVRVNGVDVDMTARKRMARLLESVEASVSNALVGCKIAITSLPSVGALDAVVEQIIAMGKQCPKGLVVMETSTLPLTNKLQARDQLAAVGVTLLDCRCRALARRLKRRTWPFMPVVTRRPSVVFVGCASIFLAWFTT